MSVRSAREGHDRDGLVALVTGSTSGIGLGIAQFLGDSGYTVVLHSRTSVDQGRALADAMPGAHYIQADLSVEQDRRSLIKQVINRVGRLDVLVNNAGISQIVAHSDLPAATPDLWRQMYEVNVIAPFQLISEAEPHLRASSTDDRSSAIVNIASHAGVRPKGASIPYAASKAALIHTTRLLGVTLAPAIRVNAVAPGLVDTPLTASWTDAQTLWKERAPMRRAATPADIAQAVGALLDSNYLTGEVLLADGGLNLT